MTDLILNNFSLTQTGNYMAAAGVISLILQHFGYVVPQNQIAFVFFSAASLLSQGMAFYGRFRKGDLTLGGWRKNA